VNETASEKGAAAGSDAQTSAKQPANERQEPAADKPAQESGDTPTPSDSNGKRPNPLAAILDVVAAVFGFVLREPIVMLLADLPSERGLSRQTTLT
jgi:hypothetical protein